MKKIKVLGFVIAIVIVVGIAFHYLYVTPIREDAIEYANRKYEKELEVLKTDFNLEEKLNDRNYEDYYLSVRMLEDDNKITFTTQNEMLAFFDTYEDYFSFNQLKKIMNDK